MAITGAVLVSAAVIGWSVWQGASWKSLSALSLNGSWLGVALGCVLLRDVGYVIRLMILARGELTLKRATSSILLWELASALTPSVVGGSAVASFILHRNGLSWGRSLATVMSTALLDELYFLLTVPLVAFAVGWSAFLPETAPWLEHSVLTIFIGGYAFMFILAALLSSALFWAPNRARQGLISFFHLRLFRRWSDAGRRLAGDLRQASIDLKTMSLGHWLIASGATAISWTARFMTLNALFMAMVSTLLSNSVGLSQFDIWARQLSMWTVMMVSPTPGSSGLAELALPTFMSGVIPMSLTATAWAALVLMWRYLTYHLYVLVGGALMPVWLAQTTSRKK